MILVAARDSSTSLPTSSRLINDAKVSLPPTPSLALPPSRNVSASVSSSGSRDELEASGVAEPVPANPAAWLELELELHLELELELKLELELGESWFES